ncbi:hypothetical protein HDU79_004789 [Rhizoclosmatium sp. JEL0117]|nr:hypothetical protein HDU79_004789 [Rhizoclosmatium sp. JEL0117]
MQRYTTFPITLFRIQQKLPVSLRDHAIAMAKNRQSWDLKRHAPNNLVLPMEGSTFHTPNGMSLRPLGPKMIDILEKFKGDPTVYRMQENLKVPEGMVLIHEHSDHYSMQVAEPMSLEAFNGKLTRFLETLPKQTKQQFLDEWYDEEEGDN